MAYCRFGCNGSDAYCYEDMSGGFTVWLPGPDRYNFATARECAAFLETKRSEGLVIPQYAIDGLLEDAAEDERQATGGEG